MPLRAIARTKIQLPAPRDGFVPRARLEARLGRALDTARLVLISAPAGFGKTAALVRQLARLAPGSALAWIAADRDDDLPRLAACAVAALEPYDLPWRTSPEAIISALDGATAQRRNEIAGDFINTLVATEVARGLIVIDDAHRIQDAALFSFLDRVIERLPPHWGLVVSTRLDPPLGLARLRARGELAEFRENDLRFTLDEVDALMRTVGRDAAPERAARLLERTHGWAAGLVLALHSAHAGGAWDERHLLDYLESEVLADAPAELRRFLLRCSVLPELDAERCAAVTLDANAAHWLAEIERRSLFVARCGASGEAVLVLHDLFRDCLADLLRREHAHELPGLLRRAAATEPDTLRRVALLLQADAGAEAHRVVVEAGTEMLTSGAIGSLARLLDEFGCGGGHAAPDLDFLRGLIHGARWEFEAMGRAMRRAALGFERASNVRGRQSAEAHEALALSAAGAGGTHGAAFDLTRRLGAEALDARTEATLLRARLWQAINDGRLDAVVPLFERELALLERDAGYVDWYRATPITQFIGLAGMAPLIARWIAAAQRCCGSQASALGVLVCVMQAWLHSLAGRADAAAALLDTAAADARWVDSSRTLARPLGFCSAVTRGLRGDLAGAFIALDDSVAALGEEPFGPRRDMAAHIAALLRLRLAAACEDRVALRESAARFAALPPPAPRSAAAAERALAAGWLAESDADAAVALAHWRCALASGDRLRVLGLDLEAGLRFAAASIRLAGRPEPDAAAALRPALLRAQHAGEHLAALLVGPTPLRVLAEADWSGLLDDAEIAQLRDWQRRACALRQREPPAAAVSDPVARAAAGPADDAPHASVPLLSEREHEILARLAAGDSNKLIARAFDLSPHTVKRHVANILHKLDLRSRGQAAAWWRAHCC